MKLANAVDKSKQLPDAVDNGEIPPSTAIAISDAVNNLLAGANVGELLDVVKGTDPKPAKCVAERCGTCRVVLYGSVARGDDSPNSDIERLVIMPILGRRHDAAVREHNELCSSPVPIEPRVVDLALLGEGASVPGVVQAALRDGRGLVLTWLSRWGFTGHGLSGGGRAPRSPVSAPDQGSVEEQLSAWARTVQLTSCAELGGVL